MPSRPRFRLGCFGGLLIGALVPIVITVAITPWAFRIGGRWTPGVWEGYGTLRTTEGDEYPLYVYFFPYIRSTSRLRLNGQRPASGLHGGGWLCSAPGVTRRLDLTGDIYDTYWNTDGSQIGFRLLDARRAFTFQPQNRRYFDILGRWHGGELPMKDDGGWQRGFHPNPQDPNERASVTFTWGSYADFQRLCNAASIPEKARIPPPRN